MAYTAMDRWVDEIKVIIGTAQQRVEKNDESTVIPAMLSSLDIAGGIMSIDAMGCQKDIARSIIA